MGDVLLFLKEFAREPSRLGAVAPSSASLARSMVQAADIRAGHVVAELGAGTGPFTQAVVEAYPDNPFVALEPGAPFAAALRERFPSVHVVERLGADLPEVCAAWGHPVVDRVVSGLPWAIFPDEVQDATLDAVTASLAPDGRMVTFQYVHSQVLPQARSMRARLDARFERVWRTPITWANVPPAFVYVCEEPRKP